MTSSRLDPSQPGKPVLTLVSSYWVNVLASFHEGIVIAITSVSSCFAFFVEADSSGRESGTDSESMTSPAHTSSELKDQGNELFRKKDYKNAISKFTEALELDGGSNAVLLANRAACHLALKRYGAGGTQNLFSLIDQKKLSEVSRRR